MEQYIFSVKQNIICQDSNGKSNYRIVFVYMKQYIFSIKENMICQNSNRKSNYRINFNEKIHIKIMRRKIVKC
jgi:hypothetical protein